MQLYHFLGKTWPVSPVLATLGPASLLLHVSHLELHLNFTISNFLLNSAVKFTVQSQKATLENSRRSMLCTYSPREYTGNKSITARNAATKSKKFNPLSPSISHRLFLFNLSPPLCPFFNLWLSFMLAMD